MIGVLGTIGAAIVGVVSAISTFATTVGGAIVGTATALVAKLPNILIAKEVIEVIGTVVSKIAEFFGIGPKDEEMEELGAKAMQEGTRPRLEEESTQEYLDYLRNEVKLDQEKFEKLSETEKLACSVIGTRMVANSIEEKTGVELPSEFLLTAAKSKMQYEEITKFISNFKEQGIKSLGDITAYLGNSLEESKVGRIDSIIVSSLKELNPNMSVEDIREKIIVMKQENNKSL